MRGIDIHKEIRRMNEQITKYISEAPEQHRLIMERLRELIHKEVPSAVESFKWGRPVFSSDTDFAYLKTAKSYVTLGFFKFDKIKNDTHLLEGTGKDMRHIKIKRLDDLQPELIEKWISQVK